jgi:hypothetical protein
MEVTLFFYTGNSLFPEVSAKGKRANGGTTDASAIMFDHEEDTIRTHRVDWERSARGD